jgi:hypothetical protein
LRPFFILLHLKIYYTFLPLHRIGTEMNRVNTLGVALLALALGTPSAHAQSTGSFSAAVSNVAIVPTTVCNATSTSGSSTCSGTNFLQLQIKTSSGSGTSLLVGGSLETSILTDTSTTGGGGKQTATAEGSVMVTMLVDGAVAPKVCPSTGCPNGVAYPSTVTYDERLQQLTTNLGNICTTTNGVTTCTSPESIDLLLSTASAHGFNFVVPNLSQGTHTVTMNIAVSGTATASSLLAGSKVNVAVGVGSLTAQVVKTQTPMDAITLGTGSTPTFQF